METYKTKITRKCSTTRRWWLESPNQITSLTGNNTLLLSGWFETHKNENLLLLTSVSGAIKKYPLNQKRHDVINTIESETLALMCGYSYNIEASTHDFIEIGFEINKEMFWVATVTFHKQINVIIGEDNFLFLDNDSNNSVDQFTGALKLNHESLLEYRNFLDEVDVISTKKVSNGASPFRPVKNLYFLINTQKKWER